MKKLFRLPALCALLAASCLAAQTAPPPNADIYTFAGNPTGFFDGQGFSGDGGPATSAKLFQPFAVTVDAAGNVFFTDTSNQRIRRVDAVTGIITTIAGNGGEGFSGDGGLAINAEFDRPWGIAVDAAGDIYVSDYGNQRVRKIDASTGIIQTFAGDGGEGYGSVGDGGPATSAQLSFPMGLALDSAGNLYIADSNQNRIRKVNARTNIITTVAGNGADGDAGDGGPATSASLWAPSGIAVDAAGDIFIADSDNNAIRRVDAATGIITTVAGDGSDGYNGDGIPATTASLSSPGSVILDSSGNFYIADSQNVRIRKVDVASGIISTIAGTGVPGWGGDGGPADQAPINVAFGIAFDGKGDLLIADTYNNCIRIVGQKPSYGISTTTSLAVSANTIPVGSPLTLSAIVTAASGATPAGTVNFYNSGAPMGLATLNGAGVAELTLTPGVGTYSITAGYAGSSTDMASQSSPPIDVTVVGIATTTVLAASSNSLQAGQTLTLTSRVSAASGGIPTGTITFLNGTTPLGSAPVDGTGRAVLAVTLPPGAYSIFAQYGGSSTDETSVSAPAIPVTVSKATTATSLTVPSSALTFGTPLTLTATVTAASGATPTGTVTFSNPSTPLGAANLNSAGVAALTFTPNIGTQSIVASYAGSAIDNASVSAPVLVSVSGVPTNTLLTSSLNPAPFGAVVTFTATVEAPTTPQGLPQGTVSFYDGTTLLGAPALASGMAKLSTGMLDVGQHSITAAYSPQGAFSASTSTALVEVVQPATFTLSASPASRTVYTGQAASFTLTVKPGTGFNLPVALTCGLLPANTTCAFSPAIVNGGAWTSTVSVQTSAPHPPASTSAIAKAGGLSSLAALLLLFLPGRKRRIGKVWPQLLAVAAILAMGAAVTACSAPANLTGGTPVGSQAITVNGIATNGSQSVSASTTLNLNVQSLF